MSQAKEYFHLIEKLENDPEFCFMAINANILLQRTIYKPKKQPIPEEKICKFVKNLGVFTHFLSPKVVRFDSI